MGREIPSTRQLWYIARETAEQLDELVQTRLNDAINTITHTRHVTTAAPARRHGEQFASRKTATEIDVQYADETEGNKM